MAADLEARFGFHPVFGIDPHADRDFAPDDWVHRVGDIRTAEEDMALLDDFVAGSRRKSALVNDVLTREAWDLFVAVYGESHAGGHHLWHHHDRGHPRHDPDVVRRVGDPVTTLYRSLDDAVAAQLAVVDGAATVLVLLSHGMAAHYDASHLLEEILRRVAAVDGGAPGGSRASRAAKGGWRALPPPLRRRAAPLPAIVARWVARRRALTTSWVEVGAADRAAGPFFMEPNNSVYGGVRLNLVGREPNGVVDPGAADDVLARVSVDLLDLVNVATGRPVVRAVHRVDEHHDRWDGDCLPDLFVDWNHDAPVETVWSPKVGLLHGPFGLWRTGDHRPGGLLLAAGPDIEPGVADRVRVIDLGPSIAARLGVELPAADGRVVPWLAGAHATV